MPLVVRDLARASGRQVEVTLRGAETQIDKGLVDQLLDPLPYTSCVTRWPTVWNLPEERMKRRKEPVGQLILSGQPEGDSIAISVRDDGRGLDKDGVLKRAGFECRPGE